MGLLFIYLAIIPLILTQEVPQHMPSSSPVPGFPEPTPSANPQPYVIYPPQPEIYPQPYVIYPPQPEIYPQPQSQPGISPQPQSELSPQPQSDTSPQPEISQQPPPDISPQSQPGKSPQPEISPEPQSDISPQPQSPEPESMPEPYTLIPEPSPQNGTNPSPKTVEAAWIGVVVAILVGMGAVIVAILCVNNCPAFNKEEPEYISLGLTDVV